MKVIHLEDRCVTKRARSAHKNLIKKKKYEAYVNMVAKI